VYLRSAHSDKRREKDPIVNLNSESRRRVLQRAYLSGVSLKRFAYLLAACLGGFDPVALLGSRCCCCCHCIKCVVVACPHSISLIHLFLPPLPYHHQSVAVLSFGPLDTLKTSPHHLPYLKEKKEKKEGRAGSRSSGPQRNQRSNNNKQLALRYSISSNHALQTADKPGTSQPAGQPASQPANSTTFSPPPKDRRKREGGQDSKLSPTPSHLDLPYIFPPLRHPSLESNALNPHHHHTTRNPTTSHPDPSSSSTFRLRDHDCDYQPHTPHQLSSRTYSTTPHRPLVYCAVAYGKQKIIILLRIGNSPHLSERCLPIMPLSLPLKRKRIFAGLLQKRKTCPTGLVLPPTTGLPPPPLCHLEVLGLPRAAAGRLCTPSAGWIEVRTRLLIIVFLVRRLVGVILPPYRRHHPLLPEAVVSSLSNLRRTGIHLPFCQVPAVVVDYPVSTSTSCHTLPSASSYP
jgi:hypothetical protein